MEKVRIFFFLCGPHKSFFFKGEQYGVIRYRRKRERSPVKVNKNPTTDGGYSLLLVKRMRTGKEQAKPLLSRVLFFPLPKPHTKEEKSRNLRQIFLTFSAV